MEDWIISVILGALAGALTSEIRDRYKEARIIKQQRKILAQAFKSRIQSDLDILECRTPLTKCFGPEETVSSISASPLWELKQTEVFQHAPDLASYLSDYFTKLNILLSKMSYRPNTRIFVSTYDSEDIKVVIDAANSALTAIDQYILQS